MNETENEKSIKSSMLVLWNHEQNWRKLSRNLQNVIESNLS